MKNINKNTITSRNYILVSSFGFIVLLLATSLSGAEIIAPAEQIFARVGTSEILVNEYKSALIRSSRTTFYHAKPPENELLEFQKKVADEIINRELVLQQAGQLQITIDDNEVEQELDKYRQRAARRGQQLDEQGETWLKLVQLTRGDLLVAKVEETIRQQTGTPTAEDLQKFYSDNLDKFTEPARYKLSTLLLGVAPSAAGTAWDAARTEAEDLVKRLRAGEDFSELARIHSSDVSAENGGDLGYAHKGMFSAQSQEVIENLKPGEISDPLRVLEGIVIFKLHDIQPARQLSFGQVSDRVLDLWMREARDKHWQDYIDKLRNNTTIEIDEKYLTLSGGATEQIKETDNN